MGLFGKITGKSNNNWISINNPLSSLKNGGKRHKYGNQSLMISAGF